LTVCHFIENNNEANGSNKAQDKDKKEMKANNARYAVAIGMVAVLSLFHALNAAIVRIGSPDKTTKPGFIINTFSNTVTGVVKVKTNDLNNVVTRRGNVSSRGTNFTRSLSSSSNSGFLTKEQDEFYRTYTRQVAHEIITITNVQYVVATWRKGDEMWQTTNQVVVIQGRQQTDKLGDVEVRVTKLESIFPVHYSKLKLITNLKSVGKWSAVKEQLEKADCMDEWNASMFILDTHPLFIAATNDAVKEGICTVEQIKTLLENSVDR
jgi:hypothetical protein